jgi:hypothetical protein
MEDLTKSRKAKTEICIIYLFTDFIIQQIKKLLESLFGKIFIKARLLAFQKLTFQFMSASLFLIYYSIFL